MKTTSTDCLNKLERLENYYSGILKREIYEGLWNKGVIVLLGLLFTLELFINKSWMIGSIWLLITLAWSYMFILKFSALE